MIVRFAAPGGRCPAHPSFQATEVCHVKKKSGPFAVAVVFAVAAAVRAGPPSDAAVSEKTLFALQADARWLARVLEHLQEAAVQDLTGQTERSLYRKADAVLAGTVHFQSLLKDKVSRKSLWEGYDELDRQLQELLKAAQALGPDARGLAPRGGRVEAAAGELEHALLGTDVTPLRRTRVLKRQALRLLSGARVGCTAQYALSDRKGALAGDFHRFVEAVAALQKGVDAGAGQQQLRKDYAKVSAAWQKVATVLKRMKASENLYLIRVAGRTDRMLGACMPCSVSPAKLLASS